MTGIERLRRLASDMRDSGWQRMHDDLAEIADLIEREYGRSAETVRADAMEAWRWVRKRGGLATLQIHEETFADMMRQRDEYRAIARDYERDATWVREHGGLDEVRKLARYETKEEIELVALGKLRCLAGVRQGEAASIADMAESIARRLMPEGYEWSRYEDGKPVRIGGAIVDGLGHAHEVTSIEFCKGEVALHWNPAEPEECVWVGHGEPVRRPENKCRDCAHWQKDPTADKMGVCWFFYHEHEGQDCYPARLGDIGACDEFMPRARALAERERGER